MSLDHTLELVEESDAGVGTGELVDIFDVRILGS
jgi:hypothetical protein